MVMKKKSNGTKAGATAQKFIARNQAINKLQVRLPAFRRLCILKGIHPREPKKKPRGPGKTYYHLKDINFLAHEPLLKKFREIHTHERKIHKANTKLNGALARRLANKRPTYKLDHLVKERYPSFVDALRDLDDALTLVHLFAVLPAHEKRHIPKAAVQTSRRLALEWQAYVVKTASLRKVFIAVKGVYFQAEVLGQTVTWLVPHQLSQVLPENVDFKVMVTFSEFYHTLLQFVNFKLYHTIGVSYPPVVDPQLEEAATGLAAIMQDLADPAALHPAMPSATDVDKPLDEAVAARLDALQEKLRLLQEESAAPPLEHEPETAAAAHVGEVEAEVSEDEDEEAAEIDSGDSEDEQEGSGPEDADAGTRNEDRREGEDAGAIVPSTTETALVGGAAQDDDDAAVCASLFRGLVFFLGREVPREQLLVVIRAFGGQVGWEGEQSPIAEDDPRITHQVFDRPAVREPRPQREYVQPQWVVDSANFRVLVDARLYGPGVAPPPHLSPFVNNDDEGYTPEYASVLQKMQDSARAIRQRALGLITEAEFLRQEEAAEPAEPDAEAAEKAYNAELLREAQGKRKAEDDAEVILREEEASEAAAAPEPEGESPGKRSERMDKEMMDKAVLTSRHRRLYQNLMKRQEEQRQVVDTLKKKRARLAKAS